jgi:hypothetical protein
MQPAYKNNVLWRISVEVLYSAYNVSTMIYGNKLNP